MIACSPRRTTVSAGPALDSTSLASAESSGYEHDNGPPALVPVPRLRHPGRLNRDVPFDKFRAMEIAGDQLDPHNPLAVKRPVFLAVA